MGQNWSECLPRRKQTNRAHEGSRAKVVSVGLLHSNLDAWSTPGLPSSRLRRALVNGLRFGPCCYWGDAAPGSAGGIATDAPKMTTCLPSLYSGAAFT